MNNMVGFLELPNMNLYHNQPTTWDRQTLVILISSSERDKFMRLVRDKHKPTSHSFGGTYEIDIFTNINYNQNERDPAKRNIRCIYCDDTMTMEEINSRFPNAYIIGIKEEDNNDRPQITGREISKIDGIRGCSQEIW